MLDKLHAVEEKYRELESLISDPAVLADMAKWQRLSREHAQLAPVVEKYREYKKVREGLLEAKAIFDDNPDADMRRLAEDEIAELRPRLETLERELPILLLPKDPNDAKNVIVEIRGGVGGEEAALFAGDLFRMYARYAERRGWRVDVIDRNATEIGGFKEISFSVDGAGAYSFLKYESGTHRVQRVPVTESQGRIHTSAAGVFVMPEIEDDEEIVIDPNDLRIDVYRSSGPGGQSVNTTDSAVRITHIPSGIVVSMQNEKSQLQNKEAALRVLASRLAAEARAKKEAEASAQRLSQVRTVDRSERIRTYNFPENRIADHRTGFKAHNLDAVLSGALDAVIASLQEADEAERLAAATQS